MRHKRTKKRCPYGVVKRGPRKGLCRDHPVRRSKLSGKRRRR